MSISGRVNRKSCSMTVSYTHLDVYKRQVISGAKFATSPTERVKETFSYFSLTPFGYANFARCV